MLTLQRAGHPCNDPAGSRAPCALCPEHSSYSLLQVSSSPPKIRIYTYVSYVGHRNKPGWYAFAGGDNPVLDTAARMGPHDGGAGRAADAPGRPEVGEHAAEEITPRHITCVKHMLRNTPNH